MLNVIKWGRRKLLKYRIRKSDSIRLNIGAGGTSYKGWFSFEKDDLDITRPEDFFWYFREGSIDNILAEHVVEHLYRDDFLSFLLGVHPFMKINGVIRIAVPDANHPSKYVRDLTRPGGLEPGADDHKEFYSVIDMYEIAGESGYKLCPVEYFDSDGMFSFIADDWGNGYIMRSKENYDGRFVRDKDEYQKFIDSVPDQNKDQFIVHNISYTSLIVDFVRLS